MKYTQQDVFNTVKSIIMERYDGINPKEIDKSSSLKHDLNFDSLDLLEIIMEVEKKFNISIENTSRLEKASSLGEFCYILQKQANQETSEKPVIVQTKEDVFKYVKEYLLNKYNIMNARPSNNLFVDLHFTDFDRSDLIVWADNTFDIVLPHTYFINLDDFCEKVLSVIQRKKAKEIQTQTKTSLFTNIKNIFQKNK